MARVFQRVLLIAAVLCGLAAGVCAQQGSNLDPPPVYEPQSVDAPPPEPAPPERPFWSQIDYTDPSNLVKIALLVGSIVIARRIFKEMSDY
ncbi:MAG: hypothetical protein KJZ84_21065 [Bryobacteraceae bacterium]|nr:hypothetical protein [Bryobacteraceae bacterium]